MKIWFCKGLAVALSLCALSATARAQNVWVGIEVGIELNRGQAGTLVVKRVLEGSPGEQAGLQPGWGVLAVDGDLVKTPEDLARRVQGHAAGSIVRITVAEQGGRPPREIAVKLEPRPDAASYQRSRLLDKTAPDALLAVNAGPKLDRISALKGRVVLLDFWATWCRPCMEALPKLQALHRRLARRGLAVVGVASDPPSVVSAVARRKHLEYSLVADPGESLAMRYHVYAIPTAVIIDRHGVVRGINVADLESAVARVEQLLGARAASP